MYTLSQKTTLIVLALTAIILSRAMFWFFDDPEGPNVPVVLGTALIVYGVSYVAYRYSSAYTSVQRLLITLACQILCVIGLYSVLH